MMAKAKAKASEGKAAAKAQASKARRASIEEGIGGVQIRCAAPTLSPSDCSCRLDAPQWYALLMTWLLVVWLLLLLLCS